MGSEDHKDFDPNKVVPIRKEPEPEPQPQAVVAGSLVVNCGGDRQINLNFHFGRDDEPVIQNAILDKIMALGDRQQAKYSLKKMEDEFEEAARHLRNFLNGIPMAEQTAKHQLAVLQAKLTAQREAREEVYKQGYDAHIASKRRSAYQPAGALKGRLGGMDAEIKKTEDAIAAVPGDLEQGRQKAMETVYRYQDDLKKRRAAINDLRHVAGLPPSTQFAGIEDEKPGVEG